jgi:hypothetical protein
VTLPPAPPPGPSVRREVAAAALLLGWRIWVLPLVYLRYDWFAILCAFWIFTALGSRSRAWPAVAGATMSGLFLLYAWRQLPLTWAALGIGP